MNPSRPILVATDFSPQARHAADRAARVAHEKRAALALVHVLPGEALASLRQWLGVANAPEVQMMASAAEQLDARMIVLGARGTGFLRRLVLGTTAERLLRRTTRPLLVVRQTPHEPYRRLLVALDFSPWSGQALALARRVAPHARLVLFHAFEVPFEEKLRFAGVDIATIEAYRQKARAEATQSVHRLAEAAGLKPAQWQPCIVEGDASLRLIEKEQELDCDLVVLGKHGVAASVDLLLGSVTKHVLAEGGADVLVSTMHGG